MGVGGKWDRLGKARCALQMGRQKSPREAGNCGAQLGHTLTPRPGRRGFQMGLGV